MLLARNRIILFLGCAGVLLAAGYGWGYTNAQDRFYAPESLLANELVSLDFNQRLLHYANSNQGSESRRELIVRLREQIAFVESVEPDIQDPGSRRQAEKSVALARQQVSGQALMVAAGPSAGAVPPGPPRSGPGVRHHDE